MKKLIIMIFVIVLSLVGCANNTGVLNDYRQNNVSSTSEGSSMESINFTEIEYIGIDWDRIECPIDANEIKLPINDKTIATKEDAFSIGKTIIENCWSNNKFLDYVLLAIVHSTSDNIWLFEYSIDQRNESSDNLIDCGGLYVAINGRSFELLKAWVDE